MYAKEYTLEDIQIGSIVLVDFGGERLTLIVDGVDEDIKNDRPGAEGHTADGSDERWFYCDQIVQVIKK